jgi:hypothetical protein
LNSKKDYSGTYELKTNFESNRTQSSQFDFVTANRTELIGSIF